MKEETKKKATEVLETTKNVAVGAAVVTKWTAKIAIGLPLKALGFIGKKSLEKSKKEDE